MKKVLEVELRGRDEISATLKQAGGSAEQLKRKLAEVNAASKRATPGAMAAA